jgi:hypothetical protein
VVRCQRWYRSHIVFLVPGPHFLCGWYILSVSFFFVTCTFPQYTNTWYSGFLPIVSSQVFDNTGKTYNLSRVINDDATFNIDGYKAYSPLFISASFAMAYGVSFAATTATLSHTFLYYRKQIYHQARRSLSEQPDVHACLMSVYKEVPNWWYFAIFCASVRELDSACTRTKGIRSHHVWVRCHCHRNLALRVPCMGFRARSYHWYVSLKYHGDFILS